VARLETKSAEAAELGIRVSALAEAHAALIGHQNHKQKIHYTVKIKQENDTLTTEKKKMCVL